MTSPRLLLILAGLILPLPARAQAIRDRIPAEPIDVILAIDSSLSLQRTDPHGFGKAAARDLADFLRPGDRIGVVRFGGWVETLSMPQGAVVFDLGEIPAAEERREEFLEGYRTAVDAGLGEFGRGTDFNVAFQEGVFRLYGGPAGMRSRPVWIIVYTDGGMDVVEGDAVRQAYLDAVPPEEARARETLNGAATAILRRDVLPYLTRSSVLVSVLYPGGVRAEQRNAPIPSRFPRSGAEGRETLLGIIGQMRLRPGERSEDGRARWISAGEPLLHPIHLDQGSSSVRVFVFGEVSDYTVDIVGPSGTHLLSEGGARVVESGRLYRRIEISPPYAGDYLLAVETPYDEPSRFLVSVSAEHDLALEIGPAHERRTFHPGESVGVLGRLVAAATGEAIDDADVLARLDGRVVVIDSQGNREERPFEPGSGRASRIDIPLPANAPHGRYTAQVIGDLTERIPGTPPKRIESPPISFEVRHSARIAFESDRAYPGVPARILGIPREGSAPTAELLVVVTEIVEGTRREVALAPTEGRFEGTILFDEVGTWAVEGRDDVEGVDLQLGEPAALTVAERSIAIRPMGVDASDIPQSTALQLNLREQPDGSFTGKIGVVAEMAAEEEARISAVLRSTDGTGESDVWLGGEKVFRLGGEEPRQVVPVHMTENPWGKTLEFRVNLAGVDLAPIQQEVFPLASEPETRSDLGALLLVAGVLAIAGLLGLFWWRSRPRFTEQRLWHLGDLHTSEHLLREFHTGLLGNHAVGTPEAPESMEFILRSAKDVREGRCLMRSLNDLDKIYVNQFAIAGPLEVQDGTEIIVERDGFPNRYIYYAAEPPPGETVYPEEGEQAPAEEPEGEGPEASEADTAALDAEAEPEPDHPDTRRISPEDPTLSLLETLGPADVGPEDVTQVE